VHDAVLDARDVLDDDAYRALLQILQTFLTNESLRVAAGDLDRIRRQA
jgi:hypothetical protein